ncbi:type II toxin-antitoxin system RelE/ParE family toxin [Candidatus Curtissbacteria bacterium]|nr:type II toxin-antitoxin system RelE/ParE family toxin [Candidatus Curtissbacteria bacterium]
MEKFEVLIKKSALKQLRSFPKAIQDKIQEVMLDRLSVEPYLADGKHIKKLTEGYRLRVGDYRIFYYIETKNVIVTSIVRRTSKTY